MAVAPVNKFLTVAVPVAPGPQKIYEVPTGVSSILLFAQVSNVSTATTYPNVTFWHRRTTRSTSNFRDTRVIRGIDVPPNDAVVLVDGRLVLEKDAIKIDSIYVDAIQSGIVSVTGCTYDEPSGIVTVTTLTPHGFVAGQEITMSGLEFICPSGSGITTTIFPDPQSSYVVDSIVNPGQVGTSKTFVANIGSAAGIAHTYIGSPQHTFVSAGTSSVIAGGAFDHKFVSSLADSIKIAGAGNTTPTNAVYTPADGNLVFTVPNHGLTAGVETIGIATDSLSFTCSSDNHQSIRTYPRTKDPIHDDFNIAITANTTDTFTVNVGVSTFIYHTPTNATYDPATGELVLTLTYHEITAGNGVSVRLEPESITFTCDSDNNTTPQSYPRTTDPAYNTSVAVAATTANTISLNVGPISGGKVAPLQMEFIASILENSTT